MMVIWDYSLFVVVQVYSLGPVKSLYAQNVPSIILKHIISSLSKATLLKLPTAVTLTQFFTLL